MSASIERGQMLWFNETKNVGLIVTESGERLHVHGSDFSNGAGPEGRCSGRVVSFRVQEGGGMRTATNVAFVADPNPPRARLRQAGRGRRG